VADREAVRNFENLRMYGGPVYWGSGYTSHAREAYPRVMDLIASATGDTSPKVRWAAAQSLAAHRDPRAVDALADIMFKPPEPFDYFRREAAISLGSTGDPRAASVLGAVLKDDDDHVRGTVLNALVRVPGPDSTRILARAARSIDDPRTRIKLAHELARRGGEEAVQALEEMKDDEDPQVRTEVRKLLGGSATQAKLDDLFRRLEDGDLGARIDAARTLGGTGDTRAMEPLAKATGDRHPTVRIAALRAMAKIEDGTRTVQAARELLGDGDADVRAAALGVLENLEDDESRDLIEKSIDDGDPRVRCAAIAALTKVHDSETADLVAPLLDDPDGAVRDTAVNALVELKDPRAMGPLLDRLDRPDPFGRARVIHALGRLKSREAVEPLISVLLTDEAGAVRAAAARALGTGGYGVAVQPLLQSLDDPDVQVRRAAAASLGEIGDERALAPLIETVLDEGEDLIVRTAAAESLASFGSGKVRQEILAESKGQDWFDRHLASNSPAEDFLSAVLLEALKDKDPSVRLLAILGVMTIGEKAAMGPLIRILEDPEPENRPSPEIRRAAAIAIGRLDFSRAAPALLRALGDRDTGVQMSAQKALTDYGDESLIEPLMEIVMTRTDVAQGHAIWALIRITGLPPRFDPQWWIDWWNHKQEQQTDRRGPQSES
jgi:HEAT repeat protein